MEHRMKRHTKAVLLALAIAAAAGCNADHTAPSADVSPPPQASEPAPNQSTPPPPADNPSPPPAEDTATVPTRFQGNWATDAAACAMAGHESRLTLGADRIQFHESSGAITSVASGGNDLTVTAQLSGEGETREATYRFRLSDDGNTLTDVGGGMARQRC
jgi:hypothetical protein